MCGKYSRLKFPNSRYKHPETAGKLHLIYAEPLGYHQGARLVGRRPIDAYFRRFIISEKKDAREKLLAMV